MQKNIVLAASFIAIFVLAVPATRTIYDAWLYKANRGTLVIEDAGTPQIIPMPMNKDHWRYHIVAKENTLNDTCIVSGASYRLPPNKTGYLYCNDCFRDTVEFYYTPYKATKGRLVIEYYSTRL